tara:strand:- start:2088 stop:2477 length:390 start_codon:yes stop_codon:yes gene_type:complete
MLLNKHKNTINFIDNLDDLEVNTVKDINSYKDFKILTIEERLTILNSYLDKISLSDNDKLFLINLIKNNGLKNKTDIDYDKINGCIRNIKILKYISSKNSYIIQVSDNDNSYEKQINKSKRNINKLIQS